MGTTVARSGMGFSFSLADSAGGCIATVFGEC
jgi:hypothetical protein